MSELARIERMERRTYRWVFPLCFLLFVVIVAGSRLLPRGWRPLSGAGAGRESVLAEARRNADTVLPFVFSRGA